MTRGEATVRVDDHGFTLGDGLFETLRVIHDRPNGLARHLERLAASMQALGFPEVDRSLWLDDIDALLGASLSAEASAEAALRLQVTSGPGGQSLTRLVSLRPLGQREYARRDGLRLWSVHGGRAPLGGLGGYKSTGWLPSVAARRLHPEGGALDFEGVFVDPRGAILEGSTTNIFALVEGRLLTPPADGRLLEGITRQRLLEAAPRLGLVTAEERLLAADLQRAEGIFATNALLPIAPCLAFDGQALHESPGLLESLRAALDAA